MKLAHPLSAMILLSMCGAGVALAQDIASPADDQPTAVNGIETKCTGTALEGRADGGRGYSLRLEFVGAKGQYLGDEKVDISGAGMNISVHCDGPWVLMKLPAGTYKIATDVAEGGRKDVTAHVPTSGQAHIVLRFPNAGGATGS